MKKRINFNKIAEILFKKIKIPNKKLKGKYFVIFVGVPGSGKTTIAKRLSKKYGFCRVSTDSIKNYLRKYNYSFEIKDLFKIQRKIFHKLLEKEINIISDSNSDLKKYRTSLKKLARSKGYKSIVIYIKVSTDVAYHRIIKKKKLIKSKSWYKKLINLQNNLEIPRKAIKINGDLKKEIIFKNIYKNFSLF